WHAALLPLDPGQGSHQPVLGGAPGRGHGPRRAAAAARRQRVAGAHATGPPPAPGRRGDDAAGTERPPRPGRARAARSRRARPEAGQVLITTRRKAHIPKEEGPPAAPVR